ncbi:MAG: AAA family ATPase [Saprospiraceae bacterium]
MAKVQNSNGKSNLPNNSGLSSREQLRKGILSEVPKPKAKRRGLFKIDTASNYIKEAALRPMPKKLFGDIWFEGELCIAFADTNVGKSILAVVMSHQISSGQNIISSLNTEVRPSKVFYFDFEMSDKQFQVRYSDENGENGFGFNDNFNRLEFDSDAEIPKKMTYEEAIINSIEVTIQVDEPEIVIIDNITFLSADNEKGKGALALMKELQRIKKKYDVSMLVLAHTPKRDFSRPLTKNDLAGSKMLMNFCDSCFAIGESCNDKKLRYIKQIKTRYTEMIYDKSNVILCKIDKPDNNLLQFQFIDYDNEQRHLKEFEVRQEEDLLSQIITLHDDELLSFRDIEKKLKLSYSKVYRMYQKHKEIDNTVSP